MPSGWGTKMEQAEAMSETKRLFLEEGLTPVQIAHRQGVQPPCIRQRLVRLGLWNPTGANVVNGSKGGRPKRVLSQPIITKQPPLVANDTRRVDREPCPWCAVRSDVGCRHRQPLGFKPVGFCIG